MNMTEFIEKHGEFNTHVISMFSIALMNMFNLYPAREKWDLRCNEVDRIMPALLKTKQNRISPEKKD